VIPTAVLAVLAVLLPLAATLATARVTRVITADRVAQPFRRAVATRFGPSSAVAYFVNCRWCVSMYVSIPFAAATVWLLLDLIPGLGDVLGWPARILLGALLALAYSHVTALLAGLEDDE